MIAVNATLVVQAAHFFLFFFAAHWLVFRRAIQELDAAVCKQQERVRNVENLQARLEEQKARMIDQEERYRKLFMQSRPRVCYRKICERDLSSGVTMPEEHLTRGEIEALVQHLQEGINHVG